jgi:hypothetical protein
MMIHEAYQPIIEDGRGRFPESLRVLLFYPELFSLGVTSAIHFPSLMASHQSIPSRHPR